MLLANLNARAHIRHKDSGDASHAIQTGNSVLFALSTLQASGGTGSDGRRGETSLIAPTQRVDLHSPSVWKTTEVVAHSDANWST